MTVKFKPKSLIGKITPYGEILSEPTWHPEVRAWRAIFAVTPSGPMMLGEFTITVEGQDL